MIKLETLGLSNDDCRHKKVIKMFDERGFKPLSVLKNDPGFTKLNWFSHFRLKTPLENFSSRNDLTRMSTGVTLPSDKTGKTPLDYVSCISDSFKRISKGSSYYRRILLLHKQMQRFFFILLASSGNLSAGGCKFLVVIVCII